MMNRVMIEMDQPARTLAEDVAKISPVLSPFGCEVKTVNGNIVVDVHEEDDAEAFVTGKLDEAGICCMVYEWNEPDVNVSLNQTAWAMLVARRP